MSHGSRSELKFEKDMKIDDITRQSLLYDFYGGLLTERQRQVMELYHEENLSLAEIAEEFGISRQGVHDALHKAEKSLEEYEEKLGLVAKFEKTEDVISKVDKELEAAVAALDDPNMVAAKLADKLENIRRIIDKLEE